MGGGGGDFFIATEWTLRPMNVSRGVTVLQQTVAKVRGA